MGGEVLQSEVLIHRDTALPSLLFGVTNHRLQILITAWQHRLQITAWQNHCLQIQDPITAWQITVPRSYHGLANHCPQILSRLGKSLSPDPITAWQIAVPRSYHGLANHCPQILSIGKSLSPDPITDWQITVSR